MSISKPIIAAGPTVKRDKAKDTKLVISSALPGTQRKYIDENGQPAFDDQLPQREGQLFAYRGFQPYPRLPLSKTNNDGFIAQGTLCNFIIDNIQD